jgi:hypothetical protein
MRKNFIKGILIIVIATSATACGDFLDTKIDTEPTLDDIDYNVNFLWNLANASYASVGSGFHVLDDNLYAAASDEAQRTQQSGNTYLFNDGTISPDNVGSADGAYSRCYDGIKATNYFIDYAEKNGDRLLKEGRDTVRDKTQYEKDIRSLAWYKAEVHIARAYYYFELIKRFGGVPIVERTLMDGQSIRLVEQKSYDEVVEYILKEIDDYLPKLQTDWLTSPDDVANFYGRFDRKSALAIKSRTLLYAASPLHNPDNDIEKWKKAAAAALDVINEMNYTMPENRDYNACFVGNAANESKESIFLVRQGASNAIERANYPISTPGGNSGVTPTHNLVEAYEYTGTPDPSDLYANRDPRLKATIVTNGSAWNGRTIDQSPGGSDDMYKPNTSRTGYYLKKFLKDELNLTQGGSEVHIWVVFRYAEILLNYAEAMNRAYGPDEIPSGYVLSAREALTQVRRSASTALPAVTTTDPIEFEAALKHERRIELAFEDHRYWDLLRWKEAETVLNEPVKGVKVTRSGNNFNYEVVNVAPRFFDKNKNYYLPFPRAEIVNAQGTLTQNAGY